MPAPGTAAAVDWGVLDDVLQCPGCGADDMSLQPTGLTCGGCEARYATEDGIVDFLGDRTLPAPPFYDDDAYRAFMGAIAAVHQAHYEGGLSRWIEDSLKEDVFALYAPGEGVVVDLGCGTGEAFPRFPQSAALIGVDAELSLLKRARARFPKVPLIRANLARLPFRDGALGAAFSIATLEHVFAIEAAVAEMARCLCRGGRLHVAVPTEGGAMVALARMVTSQRNAKLIGLSAADCRRAQRMDHCNGLPLVENTLYKFFMAEASRAWPFRVGGYHLNLAKSYRLRPLGD